MKGPMVAIEQKANMKRCGIQYSRAAAAGHLIAELPSPHGSFHLPLPAVNNREKRVIGAHFPQSVSSCRHCDSALEDGSALNAC